MEIKTPLIFILHSGSKLQPTETLLSLPINVDAIEAQALQKSKDTSYVYVVAEASPGTNFNAQRDLSQLSSLYEADPVVVHKWLSIFVNGVKFVPDSGSLA